MVVFDMASEEFTSLLKENQELKLELSGYRQAILDNKEMLGLKEQNDKLKKKYENAVSDYEKTMFEKEQLNSLVNRCQEEIRRLKKQLEENKDKINWYENFEINKTIDKLRIKHNNQQKEFIKYLEDNWKQTQDIWYIKILQKYKSIIGSKE